MALGGCLKQRLLQLQLLLAVAEQVPDDRRVSMLGCRQHGRLRLALTVLQQEPHGLRVRSTAKASFSHTEEKASPALMSALTASLPLLHASSSGGGMSRSGKVRERQYGGLLP